MHILFSSKFIDSLLPQVINGPADNLDMVGFRETRAIIILYFWHYGVHTYSKIIHFFVTEILRRSLLQVSFFFLSFEGSMAAFLMHDTEYIQYLQQRVQNYYIEYILFLQQRVQKHCTKVQFLSFEGEAQIQHPTFCFQNHASVIDQHVMSHHARCE